MKRPTLSAKTPSKSDFIEGVDSPESNDLPWKAPGVRQDVTKVFNLRLSETDKLKLDFIGTHKKSAHQFCLDILLPAIDAEIQNIIDKS